MGAAIPAAGPTRIRLRARVGRADGQTLHWIRNGQVMATGTIGADPLERQVEGAPGDWFSVNVLDGDAPTLVSNPVYLRPAPAKR
jgi:hypothetical protein